MPSLRFSTLTKRDLFAIEAQPSQAVTMGMAGPMSEETAAALVAQPVAWSARRGSELLACFGIAEEFPGRQGLAWCILAAGIGASHLELTRFMRSQIEGCGLARVELYAKAPDLEALIAAFPTPLDSGQLVALALEVPTPDMRWAIMLGMTPAHVKRCFGAASESYMLFERIVPPGPIVELDYAASRKAA